MIGGGVALVPGEDDLLELVGSGAKDGQPNPQLGHELGLVGRVHLKNMLKKNFHFLYFEFVTFSKQK